MQSNPDVMELCNLLQGFGFRVLTLDRSGDVISSSQDGAGAGRVNVVLKCATSGVHVVMESSSLCSCPPTTDSSLEEFAAVGVAGGQQPNKDTLAVPIKEHQSPPPKMRQNKTTRSFNDPAPGTSRQLTYSISPVRSETNLLDRLSVAEKAAEDLRNQLSNLKKELTEEATIPTVTVMSPGGSSQILGPSSSEPTLTGLAAGEGKKAWKLRRLLSPSFLKAKKETEKMKPPTATQVHITKSNPDIPSSNLRGSKKKYSHIKSTIPRAAPIKKK